MVFLFVLTSFNFLKSVDFYCIKRLPN